jgi:N-acetyltransferase B complex (NatB) non catalytic subunit
VYNELDTKQIQTDSLSYLLYPGCMRCGYYREAAARSKSVLSLHRSCNRDTRDYVGKAALHGNYSKMLEIVDFQVSALEAAVVGLVHAV